MLKDAGIPMRYKLTDGILHWKMMLFVGQGKVEFSGANYSGNFFVPDVPNVNYMDEAIYFTDDPSLIQSFKTKYDDVWTNTARLRKLRQHHRPALTRKYPTFPINPELNFPAVRRLDPGLHLAHPATHQRRDAKDRRDHVSHHQPGVQRHVDCSGASAAFPCG